MIYCGHLINFCSVVAAVLDTKRPCAPCRTDNPDVCPPKVAATFVGGGGVGAGTGHIAAKLPDTESEGSLEEPTKEVAPAAAVALERDDSAHPH